MKPIKTTNIKLINIIKIICLFLLIFINNTNNAQLSGFGLEFNSGININSSAINSFGINTSFESGGTYLSIKNLVGAKREIVTIDNEGLSNTVNTNLVRHQFQVKYWFGNMIRARKIHPLRCAHRVKIREDYHFKPYLLIGIDNGFDLEKNNSDRYQLSGVFGLGANIKKFGNIYSARLLFIELRSQTHLINYKQYNSVNSFSRIGFEAAVGIKFY